MDDVEQLQVLLLGAPVVEHQRTVKAADQELRKLCLDSIGSQREGINMLSEIFNTRINYSDKEENCSIKVAIDKQLEETSEENKGFSSGVRLPWTPGVEGRCGHFGFHILRVRTCVPSPILAQNIVMARLDIRPHKVKSGFELQEDKVQRMPPWRYLGLEIGKRTIVPQKLEIKAKIQTLADVHQLCGALNLGEKTLDAIKHLIQAFSFMGHPKRIKTDNGPAYRSKEFCSFLQQWGVGHKTGIPHSQQAKL
ncbi:hypothetical protein DUI87_07125 [Hirundo rustica rustica]|uniref:Integrase catalytic domain-containing protein n=1 Tax=Hirundo rustica rustica TaxID=333673 RepID=A0A3M0KPG4_HIRRU|nr:hypothetical protein DUI87_07125 [Hirundo rustica rustica]